MFSAKTPLLKKNKALEKEFIAVIEKLDRLLFNILNPPNSKEENSCCGFSNLVKKSASLNIFYIKTGSEFQKGIQEFHSLSAQYLEKSVNSNDPIDVKLTSLRDKLQTLLNDQNKLQMIRSLPATYQYVDEEELAELKRDLITLGFNFEISPTITLSATAGTSTQ